MVSGERSRPRLLPGCVATYGSETPDERTLIPALIPRGAAHVDAVSSLAVPTQPPRLWSNRGKTSIIDRRLRCPVCAQRAISEALQFTAATSNGPKVIECHSFCAPCVSTASRLHMPTCGANVLSRQCDPMTGRAASAQAVTSRWARSDQSGRMTPRCGSPPTAAKPWWRSTRWSRSGWG